ncbi:E3 ubiquitin-protein ligase RNF25-like [Argopecten irradians]|uniref:E3 ubiquitin-protein ligase RNF25-like n=1 Tax=Argopecten irradians TaxID=31199 RepID=UPI0037249C37
MGPDHDMRTILDHVRNGKPNGDSRPRRPGTGNTQMFNFIDHPCSISLQLHPATGEDVHKKFVCMTLILNLPVRYPNELPEIVIRNPRGIGEEELESLHEAINELAGERQGGHMLYDIIELAKESLTEGNVPHCPCTICLEHFCEGEEFTRTGCYHYFHQNCLYRYVNHTLESLKNEADERPKYKETTDEQNDKVLCPVCREMIEYDLDHLSPSQGQSQKDDFQSYKPSEDMRKWQVEMAVILESQKQKGGVIDLEEEKNKFLVKAEDTVQMPGQGTSSEPSNETKDSKQTESSKTTTINGKSKSGEHSGSKTERPNRDHPRPRSGNNDRNQRYRGHRNYSRGGHRPYDGRGIGAPHSSHTGEGNNNKRKGDHFRDKHSSRRSNQTKAVKADQTDGSEMDKKETEKHDRADNVSLIDQRGMAKMDNVNDCVQNNKLPVSKIESESRSNNRTLEKTSDPKRKQTHDDKGKSGSDFEQKLNDDDTPTESTDKESKDVSLDSVRTKESHEARSDYSSRTYNNSRNYRGRGGRWSDNDRQNYHQGKNYDEERGNSSYGRGQGRSERGRGRGSRRSANQELVKKKSDNGPSSENCSDSDIRNKDKPKVSHQKSDRTVVSEKDDKRMRRYEETNWNADNRNQTGSGRTAGRNKSSSGQSRNESSSGQSRNESSSGQSRSTAKSSGGQRGSWRNREIDSDKSGSKSQHHKHLNSDCVDKGDTAAKDRPRSGGKRPPPGFSQVPNVNISVPPGFEKSASFS